MAVPTRIPLPQDLPSPWEHPDDEDAFWHADRMHFPNPITQIDDALMRTIYSCGMNATFALYDMPMRMEGRRFWTYHYTASSPINASQEEIEAMGKRSEEKLGQTMGRLSELWEDEWLPRIKEHITYWESFDLRGAELSDLVAHLDETLDRTGRLWEIHFTVVFPVMLAVSLFDEFYQDVFESESPFAPYRLLQGFENRTVESGRKLWHLSRKALESPNVRTVLEERAVAEVIPALRESPEGQAFLAELRAYLSEFGHRGETWGVSYPSWIEDPAPVIKNLKDYVAQPDRNPDLEQAALIAERDQAIAEAREKLQGYPEAVRKQFESLLRAAQRGNVLSEDHGYWIDFRAMYEVRQVFVELGRRFVAAGVIEDADDIFYLTPDEIRQTAGRISADDRKSVVAERKAEMARYRSVQLPPAVGTQPPGPPPDNPGSRVTAKFWGAPPKESADPDVLNGSAGSAGIVRGRAKVVRSLGEAVKVERGDVLVAETTSPPWTPLFATVAAVVTDTGGILSHCAVVAREYGIPAVVGTGKATAIITDGQLLEVDGDHGIVRIIAAD